MSNVVHIDIRLRYRNQTEPAVINGIERFDLGIPYHWRCSDLFLSMSDRSMRQTLFDVERIIRKGNPRPKWLISDTKQYYNHKGILMTDADFMHDWLILREEFQSEIKEAEDAE